MVFIFLQLCSFKWQSHSYAKRQCGPISVQQNEELSVIRAYGTIPSLVAELRLGSSEAWDNLTQSLAKCASTSRLMQSEGLAHYLDKTPQIKR